MPRKGLTTILICCAGILTFALFAVKLTAVEAESAVQTWPSRTPTPGQGQTRPPGGSTPGGGGQETATGESSPSALTPTVNQTNPAGSPLSPTADQPAASGTFIVETRESENNGTAPGNFEQAGECGIPPYIEALGPVSVRTEAGVDHKIIGYLRFADLRTIIGRSDRDPWWLITFDSDNQGWVSDQAVLVHGYTGYVPVVDLGETSPAAGSIWIPTPIPECTPPAPETDTGATQISATTVSTGDSETSDSTDDGQEGPPNQGAESDDAPAEPQNSSEFDNQQNGTNSSNRTFTWLLVTGVFLVVAGAISFFVRKRNY